MDTHTYKQKDTQMDGHIQGHTRTDTQTDRQNHGDRQSHTHADK